jgi:TP901 family phage tail tape measure protein/lambda family phage tail tape measure protein
VARRLASLLIDIEASTANLARDVNRGVGIMDRGARRMQDTANRLKRTLLTIVSVEAFRRAAGAALQFEQSLSRMVGLSGVAASEIEGMRTAILRLAPAVAKGPNELAEALFFITSSGLQGAAALETLEASAKAATAGLGQTKQVADAVTSVLNAYGTANITAAQAVDVLVATVREGKAEADSLAGQFGKLLPLAVELNVGFDQIGAGMAFLTRATGSAEQASTQLGGILAKLIKPSRQAGAALAIIGETTEGLRRSVAEKGLLPALTELRTKFGSNSEALAKVFFDVQALTGVLQLTGVQAAEAAKVFDSLADSTGSLDSAFAAASETGLTKLAAAQANLNVVMIEFTDHILPTLINLLVPAVIGFNALVFAFGGGRDRILEIADSIGVLDARLAQLKKTKDGYSSVLKDFHIGGGFIVFGDIDKQIEKLEKERAGLQKKLDAINQAAVGALGLGKTDAADEARRKKELAASLAEADKAIAAAKAKAEEEKRAAAAAKAAATAAAQAEKSRLASIQSIIDALADENFALGRSTEEVLRNNLAKLNTPPADVDRAVQLLRENEAYKANTDAIEKYNAALKQVQDEWAAVVESTRTPSEVLNQELTRLARLRELVITSANAAQVEEDYARAVAKAWKTASEAVDNAKDKMSEFAVQAAHNIQDTLGDQLFNILQGNFDNIFDSFKAMLDRMVAEALAAQLAAKLFGDFGNTGSIGGIFGSILPAIFGGGKGPTQPAGIPYAKGGAFYGGNVIPFAHGGVVASKTLFPTARGMGMMGESGPEAIMPLKRLPGGALGVRASGAGAVVVNINISGITDARGIREAAANTAARAGATVQAAMARNN